YPGERGAFLVAVDLLDELGADEDLGTGRLVGHVGSDGVAGFHDNELAHVLVPGREGPATAVDRALRDDLDQPGPVDGKNVSADGAGAAGLIGVDKQTGVPGLDPDPIWAWNRH